MNTATMLHRTAMELYDLAGIYKTKGQNEFFDDYRKRAWLLEKEAALHMLAEPKDYTFKYLVIKSAGSLGYDYGAYVEAQKVLELGLMGNPKSAEKYQMEALLKKIKSKINASSTEDNSLNISGTLTSADIENNQIKVREGNNKSLRSITVSADQIKNVIRFYLGELVDVQLSNDDSGNYILTGISKMI